MNPVVTMLISIVSASVMIFASIASGYDLSSARAACKKPKNRRQPEVGIACTAMGFAINGFLFWLTGSLGALAMLPWLLVPLAIRGVYLVRAHYPDGLCMRLWLAIGTVNQWLAGGVMLIWVALAGTTLYPHSHGDALYYHLSSAWIWTKQGIISHIDWMPWYLQGGLGEYFYTGLATISRDRMAFVLSGQVTHFFFGYLLPVIVFFKISRSLLTSTDDVHRLPENQQTSLALLGTIAVSLLPEGLSILTHAKNDGFVLLFEALSLKMLISTNRKSREQSIVFAALALAYKSSALFYLLPFGAAYLALLWADNKKTRNISQVTPAFIYSIAVYLGAATIVGLIVPLRNYILTGTPFFPAMTNLFPSPLIDSATQKIVAGFTKAPGTLIDAVVAQGHRFIWSMPFFLLAVVGSVKFFKNNRVKTITAIHFGGLFLYTMITGQGHSSRFLFIAYGTGAVLGALGTAAIWSYLERLFKKTRYGFNYWIALILFAGIIPWSAIEVPFVQNVTRTLSFAFSNEPAVNWFAQKKSILPIQLWINDHRDSLAQDTGKPLRVLSFLHNQNLFLDIPMSVPENELRASQVKNSPNYESSITALCQGGFTHLLIESGLLHGYMDQVTQSPNFERDFPVIHQIDNYQLRSVKRCLPVKESLQPINPEALP